MPSRATNGVSVYPYKHAAYRAARANKGGKFMPKDLISIAVTLALTILLLVLALYGIMGVEHLVAKYLGLEMKHIVGALLGILAFISIKKEL